MNIFTKRPIVLCDLDGCLVQNPQEAWGKTINDYNFWIKHWEDIENVTPHQEIIDVLNAMRAKNHHAIILTARPERYREVTYQALRKIGLWVASSAPTILTDETRHIELVMYPDNFGNSSAEFKRSMVNRWITQQANIRFMIEDYKPNCEAVRELVPVLLYERKKESQWYRHSRILNPL